MDCSRFGRQFASIVWERQRHGKPIAGTDRKCKQEPAWRHHGEQTLLRLALVVDQGWPL